MTSVVSERVLKVLREPLAPVNIEAYFARPGPGVSTYTGRLFEQFGEGGDREEAANVITADDLVAVESLSVRVPPEAAYELLHGPSADELSRLLGEIPTSIDLSDAAARVHLEDGSAASQAWALLEAQHGVGWVTAGKLLARKRPRLVPVYDNVVRCVLGEPKGVWLALHDAVADQDVREALALLQRTSPTHISALRTIDVAVWMRHHSAHARGRCEEFGPSAKAPTA